MKEYALNKGWSVLQDVKDTGEAAGFFKKIKNPLLQTGQTFSEWEPIDRLAHLQLLFSDTPYFGRMLRSFNTAPWWYKNEFELPADCKGEYASLRFESVDYYCKVWLNETFLGSHEGYGTPFEFDISDALIYGGTNSLVVKVWSSWDSSVLTLKACGMSMEMGARDMMKGTYEHADGLIQRDVNPVGICGGVSVQLHSALRIKGFTFIHSNLSEDNKTAEVTFEVPISVAEENCTATLRCSITDEDTGIEICTVCVERELTRGDTVITLCAKLDDVKIWNTWDRGEPNLYTARFELLRGENPVQTVSQRFGVRTAEMVRTESETTFYLNGKKIFLRGASYLPDIYTSAVNRQRYSRDLKAMKAAGLNAVRVHVHTAKPELYELCDELGLAVIQDSDLNWIHPGTAEFEKRALTIFTDMVLMLRSHPSIICWICMNEPDIWVLALERGLIPGFDPMPVSMMKDTPGPQLVELLGRLDPTRPYIKGSRYALDPESGDTHNYIGSIKSADTHYTDIYGSKEKLNTEFGFDAPACAENLRTVPQIYARLKKLIEREKGIEEIQYYQYRLLKYFIEHYRIMKYKPCSGCFQFLFTDLCPQSFYGVYDWWGVPKQGLKAFEESDMPIGIFMQYKDGPGTLWAVNDLLTEFPECTAEWHVTDENGKEISSGSKILDLDADCAVEICRLSFEIKEKAVYNVRLCLKDKEGTIIARNVYHDAFNHPAHPAGHPDNMSHELGMRVFDA